MVQLKGREFLKGIEHHQYSKFKRKNIPFAKVGRRVFQSLFNAESFCTENDLDVDSAIEYEDDPILKNKVQEIAKYQKAILRECLKRLEKRSTALKEDIKRESAALERCHPLDHGYLTDRRNETIAKHTATGEAREIVWGVLEELERVTGWHD